MKFHLEIDLNNAALEDDPDGEVLRLLGEAASRLAIPPCEPIRLYDINGNAVGRAWVEE